MAADEATWIKVLGMLMALLTACMGWLWTAHGANRKRVDDSADLLHRLDGKVDMIHEEVCRIHEEIRNLREMRLP